MPTICQTDISSGSEGTYTALDLAKMLQCSIRHVRNLDERRVIPGRLSVGRLVRFSKRAVDEWIARASREDADGGQP
jgi:excisionase family DNA binding protein